MTFLYVVLGVLAFISWLFSMFAAFLAGQAALARAQMQNKALLAHELRNAWESLLIAMRSDENVKS